MLRKLLLLPLLLLLLLRSLLLYFYYYYYTGLAGATLLLAEEAIVRADWCVRQRLLILGVQQPHQQQVQRGRKRRYAKEHPAGMHCAKVVSHSAQARNPLCVAVLQDQASILLTATRRVGEENRLGSSDEQNVQCAKFVLGPGQEVSSEKLKLVHRRRGTAGQAALYGRRAALYGRRAALYGSWCTGEDAQLGRLQSCTRHSPATTPRAAALGGDA